MKQLWTLLILAGAASATVSPPDSIWIENQDSSSVTLAFYSVPEAEGYQIYARVQVTHVLNSEGEIVRADDDAFAFIPWGKFVPQQETEIIRVRTWPPDPDYPIFAVSSIRNEEESEQTETVWPWITTPTHVERKTWGEVKWSVGVDVPPHRGGTSLWRTGDKWGYGITLGGPVFDITGYVETLSYASGSLTIQRHRGRMFFFGEVTGEIRDRVYHENWGGYFRMRVGAGISRKYKDLGVFLFYGLGYEGWDGAGLYEKVGLDPYPRVVVRWTL